VSTRLDQVDVVLVGFGWTGAILGQELATAGLRVRALERGPDRDTYPDFAYTQIHDELRYGVRYGLMQNLSRDTLTIRHKPGDTAVPYRRLGSFLLGTGVGGSGVHWNGQTWRFLPTNLTMRSSTIARYGKDAIPAGMQLQDWGVSYDELEPYYDRFEYLCGTSGQAGNIGGTIQPGGNKFEGPRSRGYPTPPMKTHYAGKLFADAARELGYNPFPQPSSNLSQPYKNPLGVQLGACAYCGYCERFACEMYAKSSPQTTILPVLRQNPNFSLHVGATVTRVNTTGDGKHATGVTYVDDAGQEFEQPAEIVILCSYVFSNVRLMLLSGIGKRYDPATGKGGVGRNYAYQIESRLDVRLGDKAMNPFMGAGALGMMVDEFNGDNFDHTGLGFIGGGFIGALSTGVRPIENHPTPDGTPKWGAKFKQAVKEFYPHHMYILNYGGVMGYRDSYLDLDPTYRDVHGLPLLRMTFDWHDNERKMIRHNTEKALGIAKAMGATALRTTINDKHYNIAPYQTTHNVGGAPMGTDPTESALNTYLQSWDVPNVFVMGAAAFPNNAGYNPTDTVGALAYRAADAIRTRYMQSPGPLVPV